MHTAPLNSAGGGSLRARNLSAWPEAPGPEHNPVLLGGGTQTLGLLPILIVMLLLLELGVPGSP